MPILPQCRGDTCRQGRKHCRSRNQCKADYDLRSEQIAILVTIVAGLFLGSLLAWIF